MAAPSGNGGWLAWLARFGGPGLLLYSMADGSVVTLTPGGADFVTLFLAASHPARWGYYALMATLGGLGGGLLSYQIALAAGADKLAVKVGAERLEAMRRRGWPAVLLGAILPAPFPYKLVPLAAGAVRLPRLSFLAALAVGRGLRFSLAAYVGARYGAEALRLLRQTHLHAAALVLGILLAAALAGAVWYAVRRARA